MRIVTADRKPTDDALEIAPGTWRVDDDSKELDTDAISAGAAVVNGTSARDAVPTRVDLPPDHWLNGYRVPETGWAGECDHVMGEDGIMYPVPTQEELDKLVNDGKVKKGA